MRKMLLSIFWKINGVIMILYLVNYFFNYGQENIFNAISTFLYKGVLPCINIILVLVGILIFSRLEAIRAKFVFEREFAYMFCFLLISISTSAARTSVDRDFIFYMTTVLGFALVVSFLPIEKEVAVSDE